MRTPKSVGRKGPSGHKYGGSKEVTVRMWIGVGQTRDLALAGSQVVDNHLLFLLLGSTLRVLHRYPSNSV